MAAEFDFHKTGVAGIGGCGFDFTLTAIDVDDFHTPDTIAQRFIVSFSHLCHDDLEGHHE